MRRTLGLVGLIGLAAGCTGGGLTEGPATNRSSFSLASIRPDDTSGDFANRFGGVLHFDDQPHPASAPRAGYRIAWTLRAESGLEFKLWSRRDGTPGAPLALYGPRASDGSYGLVAESQVIQDFSILRYQPSAAGIYLVVQTASAPGNVEIGLNCAGGGTVQCELSCVTTLEFNPMCGADGRTYDNRGSAACFDVPIDHPGECTPPPPRDCSAVKCQAGTHCELVQVECFTTPCDPQPTCVPDDKSCLRTGCAGQICADELTATTCEWRERYACFASAACERQADGTCGWTATQELQACLDAHP